MREYFMALGFEWDVVKSNRNYKKHGIKFDEARTVFNDPLAITIADPEHSDEEDRYIDIGLSVEERIIVVWYTEREENIRIVGCRRANRIERKTYEERE